MPLTTGVDITDNRRRMKDISSKMESGVAGRNMTGKLPLPQRDHVAEIKYGGGIAPSGMRDQTLNE